MVPTVYDDDPKYIVIASDSRHALTALGTRSSRLFRTEQAAERHARQLRQRFHNFDFLVLPVQAVDWDDS